MISVPIEDPIENAENMIEWSKEYRLTWGDFQRDPILTRHQAESVVGFRRKFTDTKIFEEDGKYYFKIICDGVISYFKKKESWVLEKQKVASNQEMILKHEQGHFDLMEIYAIQYWNEIQKLCKKTFECLGNSKRARKAFSEKKGKKLLDKMEKIIAVRCNVEQKEYDDKTNYGQKETEQLRYLEDVESRLQN